MKKHILPLMLALAIAGCVGTDFEDDPKDSAIIIDESCITLIEGETEQIAATYWYNMWVEDPSFQLNWQSEDQSIARVDKTGLVEAVSQGQASIMCFVPGEDTLHITVIVVKTIDDVAKILLSASANSLQKGESLQITPIGFNTEEQLLSLASSNMIWNSSDENIVTVDANGLVKALADGQALVTATVGQVKSESFPLVVGGGVVKTGLFMDANGYNTSGMVSIYQESSGDLILELGNDFATSFALGTFLYLSNSTTGNVIKAQGLEISEISSNGSASFNLTAIDPNVTIDDYQYVIMLCKPFAIPFGIAELR